MKLSSSHTHAFRMILVGELLDINKVLLPQPIRDPSFNSNHAIMLTQTKSKKEISARY